jgi:hypothetical protein
MTPYYADDLVTIYHGDAFAQLGLLDEAAVGVDYHSGRDGVLPRSIAGDVDCSLRDRLVWLWGGRDEG